ncbi:MAG: transcription antitermination factor NusB [Patescibacteria group bacterium]|jgi:N utilization substance protein B
MKTRRDPRHQQRQKLVKRLFAYSFQGKNPKISQNNLIKPIVDQLAKIDKKIVKAAPEFPLERLNRIDLAILRLAVFELLIEKKEPIKVIIDEAIELAKEFGSEKSPGFINGALGAIVNNSKLTIKN